jgi:hypothetical protein
VYARDLKNVVVLHADSAQLNYDALVDVGLVFIDGSHSFEDVRADTECALQYFRRRQLGTIVWHDYRSELDWCGVKPYLDSLGMNIFHIDNTWLAFTRIGQRGTSDIFGAD